MSFTGRFSTIDKAMAVAAGNTLTLCGDAQALNINTSDLITPIGGTTRDWNLCGSGSGLSLPTKAVVLFAELVWYSTVKSSDPTATDCRTVQDSTVLLTTPAGEVQVTPTSTQSYTQPSGSVCRFRSAEVTLAVRTARGGTYALSKIPVSIPPTGLSDTSAGWTLTVIYREESLPPRKVDYHSGVQAITGATPYQKAYIGFEAAENSGGSSYLLLTAANGGPLTAAKTLRAGPSFARLVSLGNVVGKGNPNPGSVPNNPNNNMFTGQINLCDPQNANFGLVDVAGTKGGVNHDAFVPTQRVGGRNKWDLAGLPLAAALSGTQNQLAVQVETAEAGSDLQLLSMAGLIRVAAPDLRTEFTLTNADGVNLDGAELGERLVYSLVMRNTGERTAERVTVSAAVNAACTYLPDTFKLNGAPLAGADVAAGVNIGAIPPSGVATLLFAVSVNALPVGEQIESRMDYTYQFTSGEGSPGYTTSAFSASATVRVLAGGLTAVKTCAQTAADLGSVLDYTTAITNTGTVAATNLFFQDVVSRYCTFQTGSVKVDGTAKAAYDVRAGFPLPDLDPGETCQVTFQATLEEAPPSLAVGGRSAVTFRYLYASALAPKSAFVYSSDVSTQVNHAEIVAERCSDNSYPQVGDTVVYNLTLTNTGNVASPPVNVQEPLVMGGTFVTGSVYVDGVLKPAYNPFLGFLTPAIDPQKSIAIKYSVLIEQIAPGEVIENIANVPFRYQLSAQNPVVESITSSNKAVTRTKYVAVSGQEVVDKDYAIVGDVLHYQVTLQNGGNVSAFNTQFLSEVTGGVSFIPGSVTVNGLTMPGADPNGGFTVGIICPSDTVIITFQALVGSIPSPNVVYNSSNLIFDYLPDPLGTHITETSITNVVTTVVNRAALTLAKTTDKVYAATGDALVYTTTLTNAGTVPLKNVFFLDHMVQALAFQRGTVQISGVSHPDFDPTVGFSLGDIPAATSVVVTFSVLVRALPVTGYVQNKSSVDFTSQVSPSSPVLRVTQYSNDVITSVLKGELTALKSVSAAYAKVGDVLTYTVRVANTGNLAAEAFRFVDALPTQAALVAGSVSLNGQLMPLYDPAVGFALNTLNPGQVALVSFRATVTGVPTPNLLSNIANVEFRYRPVPGGPAVTQNAASNTADTVVNQSSISMVKAVDLPFAKEGDRLGYTVTLHNTGTVPLLGARLTDRLPQGTAFVSGSVRVNGVVQSGYVPDSSFSLGDVGPGDTLVVSFAATVSLGAPILLENTATLDYQYTLSPAVPPVAASATSNTVATTVKSLAVTSTLTADKQYVAVGGTITYTDVVQTTGNTPVTGAVLTDTLPPQLQPVPGTVKINGQPQPALDPTQGIPLGTLTPNTPVQVTFDATVTAAPPHGFVQNISNLYYEYTVDPTQPTLTGNQSSNLVATQVQKGAITVIAEANRANAILNDLVHYTLTLFNSGNTPARTVVLTDLIQANSQLQAGSVYINGVLSTGTDPAAGISLGTIAVGRYTKVEFEVAVRTVPSDGQLRNKGTAAFTYTVDPAASAVPGTAESNTTTVAVDSTIVALSISADKTVVRIGDTLVYTTPVTNKGTVPAQSVTFRDVLDQGLTLVPNSVTINDVAQSNYDPNIGFLLPTINSGATTTVKFTVTVTTAPTDNILYNYATINYSYEAQSGQPVVAVSTASNTVQTPVAAGALTAQKFVSRAYATLSDVLVYAVTVTNSGTVNATGLSFTDLIPNGAAFLTGSVVVDGTAQSTYNPSVPLPLSDLTPKQFHTVVFQVRVTALPQTGKVSNKADLAFSYRLLSTTPPVNATTSSNTVNTNIETAALTLTKTADKSYMALGESVNYTITVTNTGNTACTGVRLTDYVSAYAAFTPNSVTVNGTTQAGANPNTGFALPNVPAGGSVTVGFTAKANTLPVGGVLPNAATAYFQFLIDPAAPTRHSSGLSPIQKTTVNRGSLTLTKLVSAQYAAVGDLLRYTVVLTNTGTVPATAINFRDVIQTGGTLVVGSVTVDGVSHTDFDPYESFPLGTLAAGESVSVAFFVRLTSVPQLSTLLNTATAIFTYRIDPNGAPSVEEYTSNTTVTTVRKPSLAITKAVSKAYAKAGDSILYTVGVQNSGNTDLTDVRFTDALPPETTFQADSVFVDGTRQTGADPAAGIDLGTLSPLAQTEVKFSATVAAGAGNDTALNSGIGAYSYQVTPTGAPLSDSTQSNTVSTEIRRFGMTIAKLVDLAFATLGDTLNYTVVVKNTGNSTNSELQFIDALSAGVQFVTGSVRLNGVAMPSYDPIAGFALDDMPRGGTATIRFAAAVTAVPQTGLVTGQATATGAYKVDPAGQSYQLSALSNTVQTVIRAASLTHVITTSKSYAQVGDVLTYTCVITNTGNISVRDIWFYDALQSSLAFVNGSIRVNGVTNAALTLTSGFRLGDLNAAQSVTVDFQAKIAQLPAGSTLSNIAQSIYSYTIDPAGSTITKTLFSNAVVTNVVQSVLTVKKTADHTIATVGDLITYAIQVTNAGNVAANTVGLTDILSTGAALVAGSVILNGVSKPLFDPMTGIALGDVGVGSSVTVSFTARITAVPASNSVTNQATAHYEYLLDPKEPPLPFTAKSNTTVTNIAKGELTVTKAVDKTYAKVGDQLSYTVTITNVGNIDATDIVFLDPIPQNAIFVIATIKVNGVSQPSYNPEAGFALSTMKPGEIVTVEYQVEVVS